MKVPVISSYPFFYFPSLFLKGKPRTFACESYKSKCLLCIHKYIHTSRTLKIYLVVLVGIRKRNVCIWGEKVFLLRKKQAVLFHLTCFKLRVVILTKCVRWMAARTNLGTDRADIVVVLTYVLTYIHTYIYVYIETNVQQAKIP